MAKKQKATIETVLKVKDEMTKSLSTLETKLTKLEKKFGGVSKSSKKANGNFKTLDKSVFNLNNALKAFTFAKVTGILRQIGSYVLGASSNMTELENVTTQVFEDMSDDVTKFAETVGTEMGRSVYAMKKYVSDMGAVLKGLGGLDTAKIKDMSEGLATLAVDIGSFKNVDDNIAFNALRGGIVGETESLKTLGIVINDTVMAEYALNNGIKEKWATLDATTKAQLRYNAIMEKTSFMHGDAARTIDSFANQLKVFEANTNNIAVSLGDRITPAANGFLKGINNVLKATDEWLTKPTPDKQIASFIKEQAEVENLVKDYVALSDEYKTNKGVGEKLLDVKGKLMSLSDDFKDVLSEEKISFDKLSIATEKYIANLKLKNIEEYRSALISKENARFYDKIDTSNKTKRELDNNLKLSEAKLKTDSNAKYLNLSKELIKKHLLSTVGKEKGIFAYNPNSVLNNKSIENMAQQIFKEEKITNPVLKKEIINLLKGNKKLYNNMRRDIYKANKNIIPADELVKENEKNIGIINEEVEDFSKLIQEVKAYYTQTTVEKEENAKLLALAQDEKIVGNNNVVVTTNGKGNDKTKNKTINKASYEDLVTLYGAQSIKALEFKKKEIEDGINKLEIGANNSKDKDKIINLIEQGKAEITKIDDILAKATKKPIENIKEELKNIQADLDKAGSYDFLKEELNFNEQKKLILDRFKQSVEETIKSMSNNGVSLDIKDTSIEGIGTFLKSTNISKLDDKQMQYYDSLYKFYTNATKKVKEEEDKFYKTITDNLTMAKDVLTSALSGIANIAPENEELADISNKISRTVGGAMEIATGALTQDWTKVISSSIKLITGFVKDIVVLAKDYTSEVEKEFADRKEMQNNITSFNNLKQAINDLTDSIIENTSRLASDINIAQNKHIFQELNKVIANQGLNQDIAVNGSYQKSLPLIMRIIYGISTIGLGELIYTRNKKFAETLKFADVVDTKGKNSKELKEQFDSISDEELEARIKDKVLSNLKKNGSTFDKIRDFDFKNFKFNAKQLREEWKKYIEQIKKQEEELEKFNEVVIKESLDGISVVDVNKEKKQILEYYKRAINDEDEFNKRLPELEKKVEELLKSKTEIVTAFNDVRIHTVEQLSAGNDVLSSLANGMTSYFNKIRNNIAKIQLETKNGIFNGLDEEMNEKFSEIANALVKIRLEGKSVSDLKIDFSKQFAKMKDISKINNEVLEVVKKLREQALEQGIDKSLIDKMLPLEEARKRALDISSVMRTAMTASLEANSFNQFSMSLGDSLYKHVKESLIQAFTDSEKYRELIKKYVITKDFDSDIAKAGGIHEAYDVIRKRMEETENMLKSQGLDFRSTNGTTGEYLNRGHSYNFNPQNSPATNNINSGVNIEVNIDNKGYIAVDDFVNDLTKKVKTKILLDSKKEVY